MRKLLWYLIAGTRGGINRAKIIEALNQRPYNANQLSELLHLDYKTISHHLKVLMKNHLITEQGNGYGNVYFLDGELERNYEDFVKIWDFVGKENDRK
jgi:DNA-binding transcriptional ArsR family regulator